jgi:hypothetical protein
VATRLSRRAWSTSTMRHTPPFIVTASGCAPPMPPQPAVSVQRAGEASAEALGGHGGEGLVCALQDALGTNIDPRSRGHLPVHREPQVLQTPKLRPRRPVAYQVRVGQQHPWRPLVRAEDAHRPSTLDKHRLVALERGERAHERVEARPVASRLAGAAVHHEVVRAFGHIGVEVVAQHANRRLLRPALRGQRGATCGSDGFHVTTPQTGVGVRRKVRSLRGGAGSRSGRCRS